ncbi:type II CAAX endopeptidase family protein [Pseudomonas sp. Bout1]|uniref:CPBP family intramembrane glutamic endopeptidase n=1 Tax=Pseudomonas sp. Bout1 TaxID=3048600 RepID=UPI002AB44129|nr:type II CAAX endopeptidase family protein [Pseudomonas sp. Bout1]MDY7533584.1 type II CAAX endopeptidase family protein [Pseudomonas sp. Bout1]MEB0185186.1 type II CAAX endopeptidase family protein [Pseudomonas sp. Bout1]
MEYKALSGPPAACMDTYSWRRRILMACLAIGLYLAIQLALVLIMGTGNLTRLTLLIDGGFSAVVLLTVAVIERRHSGGVRAVIGRDLSRTFKLCLPWILGVYLVCTSLDIGLGYGYEAYTMFLRGSLPSAPRALLLSMGLLIVPIFEELLYRYFLIRLFPLDNRLWRWVAILATTAVYMAIHMPFSGWIECLMIGTLSVIFAYARVRSAGILVPVLLHIFAGVLNLSRGLVANLWL